MLHLEKILFRPMPNQGHKEFPFNLPVVQTLEELSFTSPVTFFVGENGSGKSTLLEAIACAVDAVPIGSESLRTDYHRHPFSHPAGISGRHAAEF